jgi:hypothetical protein
MKMSIILSFIILLGIPYYSMAQPINSNREIQDSLSKLSSAIWKQKTEVARLQANGVFFEKFQSALKTGPATPPLDSINGITYIASDDGVLRIYTWNVPMADGTNKYFGFIQLLKDGNAVIPLKSTENEPADIDMAQLTPEMWYGAIYYKIIPVKVGEQKVYTLLGWDGYNSGSNRKLIDIISIGENGDIVFGMPVFKTDKGITSRVVLEYAEKSTMVLRYDYQAILIEKKNKVIKKDTWLIVMDHMVPMDPTMVGLRKYYVPAGDSYDGYVFRDGYWVLVEGIDVVNKIAE